MMVLRIHRRVIACAVALALVIAPLLAPLAWAGGTEGKIPVCTAQGIVWFNPSAPVDAPQTDPVPVSGAWCPLCPVAGAATPPVPLDITFMFVVRQVTGSVVIPDQRRQAPRFSAAPRTSRAPPVSA
jgi:hypothetical protein